MDVRFVVVVEKSNYLTGRPGYARIPGPVNPRAQLRHVPVRNVAGLRGDKLADRLPSWDVFDNDYLKSRVFLAIKVIQAPCQLVRPISRRDYHADEGCFSQDRSPVAKEGPGLRIGFQSRTVNARRRWQAGRGEAPADWRSEFSREKCAKLAGCETVPTQLYETLTDWLSVEAGDDPYFAVPAVPGYRWQWLGEFDLHQPGWREPCGGIFRLMSGRVAYYT